MGCGVGVFRTLAFLHHLLHFAFVVQVEGDRTIDLVQAQSRIVRLDRFGIFAITVLPNDAVNRHTTPGKVEAAIPSFNKSSVHGQTHHQFIPLGLPVANGEYFSGSPLQMGIARRI